MLQKLIKIVGYYVDYTAKYPDGKDKLQNQNPNDVDRLKYTSRSVAEIADICGYKSTEHFIRQFAKVTGMTPGAFRHSGLNA